MPPSSPQRPPDDLPRMSLLEHLEELRKRILWSIVALAVAFTPCWIYHVEIFDFLQVPVKRKYPDLKLVFLGLTDPFLLYFKVAAYAALFVASPFILYQVWAFVAPGLYRRERRMAMPFVLLTTLFFLSGAAFGYYVAFPFAVDFLLEIGQGFDAQLEIGKYLGMVLTVLLGLGLMFELPIFILLLSVMGVVTSRFLIRYFRHAVVIIFIIAAVVTPTPDVLNLCIFAVPAIVLYILGIGAAFLAERVRRKREAEMATELE
jgi:sec-independent protein translocase protein TatC